MPNFTEGLNDGIQARNHPRHGRSCTIPKVRPSAPAKIKTLRYSSLAVKGGQLFNAMPKHIRDLSKCPVDAFKRALDKYLTTIPDEPRIQGYTQYCRGATNSLTDMVEAHRRGLAQEELQVDHQIDC